MKRTEMGKAGTARRKVEHLADSRKPFGTADTCFLSTSQAAVQFPCNSASYQPPKRGCKLAFRLLPTLRMQVGAGDGARRGAPPDADDHWQGRATRPWPKATSQGRKGASLPEDGALAAEASGRAAQAGQKAAEQRGE